MMNNFSDIKTALPGKLVYGYDPEDLVPAVEEFFDLGSEIRILDVGSGNGLHAVELASRFKNSTIVGIEPQRSFFESALKNADEKSISNVTFANRSIEHYYNKDEFFNIDFIHCCLVLPFIRNPIETLRFFEKILSHNGIAIISLFAKPTEFDLIKKYISNEYMKIALPSVVFFPDESDALKLISQSNFDLFKFLELPLPQRNRGKEVEDFKAFHSQRRKKIESEVRAKYNSYNESFPLNKIYTFVLRKRSTENK